MVHVDFFSGLEYLFSNNYLKNDNLHHIYPKNCEKIFFKIIYGISHVYAPSTPTGQLFIDVFAPLKTYKKVIPLGVTYFRRFVSFTCNSRVD